MLVNILFKTCRPLVVADQHSPLRWRCPFRDVNRPTGKALLEAALPMPARVPLGAVVGHITDLEAIVGRPVNRSTRL